MSNHEKDPTIEDTNLGEPLDTASLQTPLDLPPLETPTSISSLMWSTSDLTPIVAALGCVTLDPLKETIDRYNLGDMENLAENKASAPCKPLFSTNTGVDLHKAKLCKETPKYSRTEAVKNFGRAFDVSKKLQQVMGLKAPEPFIRPPEVPKDMVKRFIIGLNECGLDHKTKQKASKAGQKGVKQTVGMKDSVMKAVDKSKLPDIKEEKENSARATSTGPTPVGGDPRLSTNPPTWNVDQQSGAKGFVNPFMKPTVLNEDEDTDVEEATPVLTTLYTHGNVGSDTTLVDNQSPRLGTSTMPPKSPASHMPTGPPQAQSFARALNRVGKDEGVVIVSSLPKQPLSSIALESYGLDRSAADTSELIGNRGAQTRVPSEVTTTQSPAVASPPLFPSPRVQEQSSDSIKPKAGTEAPVSAADVTASNLPASNPGLFPPSIMNQSQMPKVPEMAVQSPSAKKKPKSRKRAPSAGNESLGPPLTRARAEDNTGLPTLPASSEALWKFRFPGNTYALLTILINWTRTMQSMHSKYSDPKGFANNSAFPWPIKPPIWMKLTAVGFYDTSVQPNKEVRFLGPGDVAEIAYGEVDTFRYREAGDVAQEQNLHDTTTNAPKTAPWLNKASRNMPMLHRAATGEGRWAYILIKGHQETQGETAPHVIIAYHVSVRTGSSLRMHTVVPDRHPPSPSGKKPSQPNLTTGPSNPVRLHQALHAASTTELPEYPPARRATQKGAINLHRTVLSMDKAGDIPLIEGYRVDVGRFRDWLDAVGRGNAKLVMWKVRE